MKRGCETEPVIHGLSIKLYMIRKTGFLWKETFDRDMGFYGRRPLIEIWVFMEGDL